MRRADSAPLAVGLTGGIASGKSAVAQCFAALGAPVIDADQIAREVVEAGTPLLARLVERFSAPVMERFGARLVRGDGSLDRALLRRLIAQDAEERRALEALTHPAIGARMEALARETRGPYQIHVVPLLVENHAKGRYGRVLVVDCPEALQLSRLLARDGIELEQAQGLIAAQASRAARLAAADDVVVNDGELAALAPKVAALDRKYRDLAHRLSAPIA